MATKTINPRKAPARNTDAATSQDTTQATGRRNRAASAGTTNTPIRHTFQDRTGMSFTYEETDAITHTRNRASQPNPHGSGVERAVQMMTSAPTKQLSIVVKDDEVKQHVRWIRTAGNEHNVTMAIVITGTDEDGYSRINFRAKPKVTKPSRRKKTETETPVSVAA